MGVHQKVMPIADQRNVHSEHKVAKKGEDSEQNVLKDWNSGKLRYYTEPPEQTSPGGDNNSLENATEIVATFSKEFDLDALEQDIRVLVDAIPQDAMAVDTPYDPTLSALSSAQSGGGAGDGNAEMETDQKHGGGGGSFVVVSGRVVPPAEEGGSSSNMDTTPGGHGTASVRGTPLLPNSLSLGEGNVQLNSAIRKAVKKRKKGQQKMAKRAEKLAGQLSERMEF
uniref:BZIP domain-containing protein n=1 Tax=Globodera pallida TaxID=36090 RepID=A0A183C428_GLOPA